jgi:hypothetical protein
MHANTGSRGRGRPKGSKNIRTLEREKRLGEVIEQVKASLACAFDGDAHALLIHVYRDPNVPLSIRLDAAKAALRYEKPALAAIDHCGSKTVTLDMPAYSDLEVARRLAFLLARGAAAIAS